MAGRAIRTRPLDNHKPLDIIRDETLLDSTEGLPLREAVQSQAAPDAAKEKAKAVRQAEEKKFKEIPIPGVTQVPSYELDYLPTFRERNTYLRGRGGGGYEDATFVEYDLDLEDERWLATFNGDQERLSSDKLEAMLWKLDVMNAEATDKIFSFQGAAPTERLTVEACATTDHLQRQDALQMLEETCPSRDTMRVAVYEYWLEKRQRLGRPLLRRLQAPTPQNNNDPFRVFRPRERQHRPQTRRRRENNMDSLDKLNMIRDNVAIALSLFEMLVKRERKKRDMTYVITDWQQLQIKQKHEPRAAQEAIEQEYLAAAKKQNNKRPVGFEDLPEAAPAATNALLDFKNNKKNKKRKKLGLEPQLHAVAHMPPPPLPPQPNALFTAAPDVSQLNLDDGGAAQVPRPPDGAVWQPRIGRGGRLIFDRCRPFTMEPLSTEEQEPLVQPMHSFPNPYAQWLGKSELAQAAIARLDGQSDAPLPPTVVKLRVTPLQKSAEPAAVVTQMVTPAPEPAGNDGSKATTANGKRTSTRQRV